jgi:hypothetical protein
MVFRSTAYRSASASGNINSQVAAYEAVYANITNGLGPYFVNLQEILAFLARSRFASERGYARFLRAQLSPNELLIIGHHGLSRFGRDALKPLLEQFGMLKYLPTGAGWPTHNLSHAYRSEAFQD